jgi:Ino eighty subunit 1
LPEGYDTDDENSWGKGGLCPNPDEEEDFGEAAGFYLSVVRKAARRLQRWDWDGMLSESKDNGANRERRGYKIENANGAGDSDANDLPKVVASSSRGRSRGGKKKGKAPDVVSEHDMPMETEQKSGVWSNTTLRGRRSTGDGARKVRTSGRPSKGGGTTTLNHEREDLPQRFPGPNSSRTQMSAIHSDDVDMNADDDDALDDIDKELLGELSTGEDERRHPSAASHGRPSGSAHLNAASRYATVDRYRDGDADESSFDRDSRGVQRGNRGGDSDDLDDDDDLASSIYGENGYAASESSSLGMDVEGGRDDDEIIFDS